MINIKKVKVNSTLTTESTFTVIKVNKKSVIVKDSKGKRQAINSKDFAKFNMSGTTKAPAKETTATSKTTASSISLRGRYPRWANSTPKKEFVMMERGQGKTATHASYKEYREFKKAQRTS